MSINHVLIKGNSSKCISNSLGNTILGLGLQNYKKIALDLDKEGTLFNFLFDRMSPTVRKDIVAYSVKSDFSNKADRIQLLASAIRRCGHDCYILINHAEFLTKDEIDYLFKSAYECEYITMFVLSQQTSLDTSKSNKVTDFLVDEFDIREIYVAEYKYGMVMLR